MRIRWFLLLVLIFFVQRGFAQETNSYYIQDSLTFSGVILIDEGDKENCSFCHEKVNGEVVTFTPKQVKEYGIGGKRLFVAKDIYLNYSWKRVFLEKRQFGSLTFYAYCSVGKDLFFIQEGEGQMVELKSSLTSSVNFRSQLADLTKDVPVVSAKSKKVVYTNESISFFLKEYQARKLFLFPKRRMGVNIGMNVSKMEPLSGMTDPNYQLFDYSYQPSIQIGVYVVQPILQFGLSVHVACHYSNASFSGFKQLIYRQENPLLGAEYDFESKLHMLEFPILLRYTLPLRLFQPFIEVGGQFSWNFINESSVNRLSMRNDVITNFGLYHPQVYDSYQISPSFGFGVEYHVNEIQSVYLKINHAKFSGLVNPNLSKLTKWSLTTGYTF